MDFLTQYNLTGLVIGAATFLIIGLFHPLVIQGEYRFGTGCWWFFLLMGLAAVAASVAVRQVVWSTLLAVWGASSLWSIGELFEQRKRVERGWFPRNPKRSSLPSREQAADSSAHTVHPSREQTSGNSDRLASPSREQAAVRTASPSRQKRRTSAQAAGTPRR